MNRLPPERTSIQRKLAILFEDAKSWCVEWGLSRLMRDVTIEFSDEMEGALGTIDLRTMKLKLNGILLLPQNEELLRETLCHELAHAVAALRHGHGIENHGEEWSGLMKLAGFTPRAVIPFSQIARR